MKPTPEQLGGLNVALNEAKLLNLELDVLRRLATVELNVLTLPEEGPAPQDALMGLWLSPVGRVAATLASGAGQIERTRIEDLSEVVRAFGGLPIYGWEFFDSEASLGFEGLSLDCSFADGGLDHTLHLFQESGRGKLDVQLWFDGLQIRDAVGHDVSIDTFIAGGKRWWDGVFSGDPRTNGSGIQPLKK
jgi:hypothetical protein